MLDRVIKLLLEPDFDVFVWRFDRAIEVLVVDPKPFSSQICYWLKLAVCECELKDKVC